MSLNSIKNMALGMYGLKQLLTTQGKLDLACSVAQDAAKVLTLPFKLYQAGMQAREEYASCTYTHQILRSIPLIGPYLPLFDEHCELHRVKSALCLIGAAWTAYKLYRCASFALGKLVQQPIAPIPQQAPAPVQAIPPALLNAIQAGG